MAFQVQNFDDVIKYRHIGDKKPLNKCAAWTYEYTPLGNKHMDIHIPNKEMIMVKTGVLLKSYNTPIMFVGVDCENNTFIILFPYCKGGSASHITWQHISKFCSQENIPYFGCDYMRNIDKYIKDTGINVITWW